MKNILVTGGTGFIGSHTCLALLERGYKLTVIDSNINSNPLSLKRVEEIFLTKNNNIPKINFEKGDIRDEKFLSNVFLKAKNNSSSIDAVIHFAGLKAVGDSVKNPLLYWDMNLNSSLNLVKVMDKFYCRTIVFSSSATIYGDAKNIPIDEEAEIKPTNPYGHTKACIEYLLDGLFNSCNSDWRVANLRYFNPIGAHESGLIGEDLFNKPNNLFPFICGVAQGKYKHLNIFGNDWETPDGTGIRDYIHVMDLADSHCSALKFLIEKDPQILKLNIGTGIGTSVLELIENFKDINKCDIPYVFRPRRPGDVPILIADNRRAISLLDWHPKRNIQDMCRNGWDWQKLNPKGFVNKKLI